MAEAPGEARGRVLEPTAPADVARRAELQGFTDDYLESFFEREPES